MKIATNRQGDIYATPLTLGDDVLKAMKLTPVKPDNHRTILAYGEVTGHAHALCEETTTLYDLSREDMERLCKKYIPDYRWEELPDGSVRLLEVKEPTPITHEEHHEILLSGFYLTHIQQEYHPEYVSRVAD